MPLHINSNHWALVVIYPVQKHIDIFDSLGETYVSLQETNNERPLYMTLKRQYMDFLSDHTLFDILNSTVLSKECTVTHTSSYHYKAMHMTVKCLY